MRDRVDAVLLAGGNERVEHGQVVASGLVADRCRRPPGARLEARFAAKQVEGNGRGLALAFLELRTRTVDTEGACPKCLRVTGQESPRVGLLLQRG